jgi:hypothetical protein
MRGFERKPCDSASCLGCSEDVRNGSIFGDNAVNLTMVAHDLDIRKVRDPWSSIDIGGESSSR